MFGSVVRRRSLSLTVALIVLFGVGAAACGDDGDDASGSGGAPTAEDLEANTWSILEVVMDGSLEPVVDDTSPTLTFGDDGALALETGCNNGATTWELDGDDLTFGMVASTMMMCAEPEGIMDQEQALGLALEATATASLDSGQLTLLDEDGTAVLVAESAS
jgi:heat shock protein HslJ